MMLCSKLAVPIKLLKRVICLHLLVPTICISVLCVCGGGHSSAYNSEELSYGCGKSFPKVCVSSSFYLSTVSLYTVRYILINTVHNM